MFVKMKEITVFVNLYWQFTTMFAIFNPYLTSFGIKESTEATDSSVHLDSLWSKVIRKKLAKGAKNSFLRTFCLDTLAKLKNAKKLTAKSMNYSKKKKYSPTNQGKFILYYVTIFL